MIKFNDITYDIEYELALHDNISKVVMKGRNRLLR